MSRPYSQKQIDFLEALFASNDQDLATLQALKKELETRQSRRAHSLKHKVEHAIGALTSGSGPAESPPSAGSQRDLLPEPSPPARIEPQRPRVDTPTVVAVAANPSATRSGYVMPNQPTAAAQRSTPPPPLPTPPREAFPQSSLVPTNKVPDILNAWSSLEVLSPQTYRRPADLAGGMAGNIVSIVNRLPWDGGPAPSKPGYKVYFHVVLATLEAGPAYEALIERFKDSRAERPSVNGHIILASVLVDKNGVPAGDAPVSLSAFGWGWPIALRGSLKELAAWTQVESKLIFELTEQLQIRGSNGNYNALGQQGLQRGVAWLIKTLGLPAEQVTGPTFAVKSFLHFTSKIVPDALLLNSFFLRDLARASDLAAKNQLPGALGYYLGQRQPADRLDLLHDPAVLEASLAPAAIPIGRWPAPPDHSPSLLQQSAVNLASRLRGYNKILGINGPPGTGKSTLLRDVFADLVTRRAASMCTFDDPAKAFKVGWSKRSGGQTQELYSMDPSLRGFEMVVASSNNKAVENVSAEIPALNAIPSNSTMRYFAPLADAVFERKSWGMVAAVLGNATNRAKFKKIFWKDPILSFDGYLNRAAGTAQVDGNAEGTTEPTLADLCDAPVGQAEARQRWLSVREHYKSATNKVVSRLTTLEVLRKSLLELPLLMGTEADLLNQHADASKTADEALASLRSQERAMQDLGVTRASHQLDVDRHDTKAPNLLKRMFGMQEARSWKQKHQALQAQLISIRQREQAEATKKTAIEHHSAASANTAAKLYRDYVAAQESRKAAEQNIARIEVGPDGSRLDSNFYALPHRSMQLTIPWLDLQIQALRNAALESAMQVHKAFIDAAALPIRRNLKALMDANFSVLKPDRAHLLGDLWSTLFLVVPVVSTTFASVERMLGKLPPETLGWLLIDEAGQASPQAAVGALLRSQRAIVVGDPLQIEPVVPLPDVLTAAVMREFATDPDRFAAPASSVQTLSDDASDHCAVFETQDGFRTVGAPLLVHRRCSSPMFEISNRIAYANLMVQAKHPQPSAIRDKLGPSRWIDVRGSAREKYSPEEGQEVLAMLRTLAQGQIPADLYIVTPFVAVQDALRQLVDQSGVLQGWVENPRTWSWERIGTVHTVQGREAEAVILVLGATDPAQNGSRQWAGKSPNLLNVAVTRAKEALYVVGNRNHWSGAGHFSTLSQMLPSHQ